MGVENDPLFLLDEKTPGLLTFVFIGEMTFYRFYLMLSFFFEPICWSFLKYPGGNSIILSYSSY